MRTSNTRVLFGGSRPDGGSASVGARLTGGVEIHGVGGVGTKRRPNVPFPLDYDRMANTWAPEIAAAHNALIWTPESGLPQIRGQEDALGGRIEDGVYDGTSAGVSVSQEAQDMAYQMAGARWLRGEARAHESALAVVQGRAAHTREVVGLAIDVFGVSDKIAGISRRNGITADMAPVERVSAFDALRPRAGVTPWSDIRGGRMGSKENHPNVSQSTLGAIVRSVGLSYYDVDPVSGLFFFELENTAPANSNEYHVEGIELQRVLKDIATYLGERCRVMATWHSHYRSARVSAADIDNYPTWMVERALIFHQPTETTLHHNHTGEVFWEGRAHASDQ